MHTKTILITALLTGYSVGLAINGYAQMQDNALAHVKYEFEHIDDTNFRDKPHKEEMMLYIGQHSSMYNSYSQALMLEKIKKQLPQKVKVEGQQTNSSFSIGSPGVTNEVLYILPRNKQAFLANRIGTSAYIIPQDYPQIDWQISEETKEIGGYTCQRATGNFAGRRYTAWFTTELPFPYGPWKLHGLPGLILEAEDSRQEVIFRYDGFDKQENALIDIMPPKEAATTNAKEFARAKAAFDKNPMASIMRSLPTGANVETKLIIKDQSGRELSMDEFNAMREIALKEGQAKQPNNPLELGSK